MTDVGTVILENGDIFEGVSVGQPGIVFGELIFNTALTGYQEIMTDPSYLGQIVLFTAPHIGNTGVNKEDEESPNIHASGFIFNELSEHYSSWKAHSSLQQYLQEHNKVAISEVDTRALTQIIRDHGAMKAAIVSGEYELPNILEKIKGFDKALQENMAEKVSINKPQSLSSSYSAKYHIVAYDFGIKQNIINIFQNLGCDIQLVPASTPAAKVLQNSPDGVFLSNGPGNPNACQAIITEIQTLIERKIPLFGICLGYQLLSLALGAKHVKMKFGHHGANHPVYDLETRKVLITSQNHSYGIDEQSLPSFLLPTHRSLFDNSLQGVSHIHQPLFGFQGHPEASPGPKEAESLFKNFMTAMDNQKAMSNKNLFVEVREEREGYA